MVPLNTALQSGQTIEIISIKEWWPSLDRLNLNLGYPKANAPVPTRCLGSTLLASKPPFARGRDAVEKLLQREGKTATKPLDDLAENLGFKTADASA